SLKFVLGDKVSAPTHTLSVASIKYHPSYNANSITNDIGLVTLASDAPVVPMKIVPSMDSSWVGRELVHVGFGVSNGSSQTGAGTKRFVRIPIASVSSKQFSYASPGKNTCNGDSGGPAFAEVNGELLLAGLTSYGDANCTQNGVDTRPDAFKDFIALPTTDPCGGETFAGRCDGSNVVWCENSQVKTQSCASQNKTCGFSTQNNYFACVEQAAADPCGGVSFAGQCDGTKTVTWCENKQIKNMSCSGSKTCKFNTSQQYFDCL
ncbi:MAG: trypsin-like serine protease, partial [Polyangiaceae bacterium]|nr:trypsin-like serine protease [Polyangiaceae bacterium]